MTARLDPSVPVLVTGASSGIGKEFARQFAARGHDVVVVARRVNRLEQVADELSRKHKVDVVPMAADLETDDGRAVIERHLTGKGTPWVLVNNAGFGLTGRVAKLDAARQNAEVQVNVVAVHQLTAAVIPQCVSGRAGGVINVGSTAAFQPIPFMATYAATKAFVLNYTEALAVELSGSGVRAMALCPGAVRTEFSEIAGNSAELEMAMPMSAEKCVRIALRAFDRNRTICIPGIANRVVATSAGVMPRVAVRHIAGLVFRRP